MNCDSVAELIEALAAGEIDPSRDLAAHMAVCPRCAAELALARRVNEMLTSDVPRAPRHFTASLLQRLPSRTTDASEGPETWFDSIANLSLVPVILGIWFLADATFLQHLIDTTASAVSRATHLLPNPGNMMTSHVAIAVAGVVVVISWVLAEEV
jgi:anti-sigma factor RsiW